MKRGEPERLICEFLKMRNGSGATITETSEATSTVYGTTRRIILQLLAKGNVARIGDDWHWKAKPILKPDLTAGRDERPETGSP